MRDNSKGKKIAIIAGAAVLLAIIGFFVYDIVFFSPKGTLSFGNEFSQQKIDIPFKVDAKLTSLSFVTRDYIVGMEIVSADGKVTPVKEENIEVEPKKDSDTEFEALVTEPNTPGSYTAVIYVSGKRSLLSGAVTRLLEAKKDFVVAEKITNGTVNFISIKGIMKVSELLTINGVAQNTGEVEKLFTVETRMTGPDGKEVDLGAKEMTLKIEEKKTFSCDFKVPDSPAGKYTAKLSLFAGESKAENKIKLGEVEQECVIAERVIKAKIDSVMTRGKLKSGETMGFDIDIKNIGDTSKTFSTDVSLTDPSGKKIDLTPKEMIINVNETKKASYEYPLPATGSHGRYVINIAVFAGAAKDLAKVKMDETSQEFTVAERITKAAIPVFTLKTKAAKVGAPVSFDVTVKNAGETDHSFPVNIEINTGKETVALPTKTAVLSVGASQTVSFDYDIPLAAAFGGYEAKAGVYSEQDASGKLVEQYDEKSVKFPVGGPTIGGTVALGPVTDKKFGETAILTAKFTNSGEADHEFLIKIEVLDSAGKLTTLVNEKDVIKKAEAKDLTNNFVIDTSMPDGRYKVTSSIWDKLGDDGNPSGKYGEDKQEFGVIDQPPVVANIIYVTPAVGKPGTVTVKVKDDKEIKDVRLVYKGPGMTEYAKDSMTKTGGIGKKEGDFGVQTRSFTYTGSFMFYIEAVDSKGQKTKSEEKMTEIK